MERGISTTMVLGVAAVALLVAGRSPGTSGTTESGPASAGVSQGAPETNPAGGPVGFRKGEELLEAFFGDTLPETRNLPATHFDFDVLFAALPDPYESRMDWLHDSGLAALQRAFESADFVLDRYWTPNPGDTLTARIGAFPSTAPATRVQPGVLLFRKWVGGGSAADRLSLRLVYLVGEVPTRGVHVPALRAALQERDHLLERLPSSSPDTTAARQASVKILGPVFSGSSYSYRRALDQWFLDDSGGGARADTKIRIISGSATSPGNKATLEGAGVGAHFPGSVETTPFRVSFNATVNSDAMLMDALGPMVLDPLGISRNQVAILQESSTAYGQAVVRDPATTRLGFLSTNAQSRTDSVRNSGDSTASLQDSATGSGESPSQEEERDEFLLIPFPMNISLLRGEYARLPAADPSVDLLPQITEGPRVALSLQDMERSPEIPASVSRMTPPALDIVIEEILRILEARDIRAVGLMATDVRDKLFLGELISDRLTDIQLFTLESNVLLRAPDYRDALKGMLILSSYPLFLENQGRVRGGAPGQLLSFSNDGAQGTYNAALLFLGLDEALLGYGEPSEACTAEFRTGAGGIGQEGGLERRPPVWLSAVGNSSLLPISCRMQPDTAGYLAERATGAGPRGSVMRLRPKKGVLVQGSLLFLVLGTWGLLIRVLRDPTLKRVGGLQQTGGGMVPDAREATDAQGETTEDECSSTEGKGHDKDEWDLQNASHLIHLGIYRGALFVALGGLVVPLGFPFQTKAWWWLVLVPAALGLALEARNALRLVFRWKKEGLRKAGFSRDPRHVRDGDLGAEMIWALEIAARTLVALAGIALAGLLIWYVVDIGELRSAAPGAFDLFVQRASQWGAGISPLLPLTFGLLGVAGWCIWHWVRIEILLRVRPFEDSCFPRGTPNADGGQTGPVPQAWTQAWRRVEEGTQRLRTRLFLLIPDWSALYFAVIMGFVSVWLHFRMAPALFTLAPTLEKAALGSADLHFGAWPVLLEAFIMAGILITSWCIYRFLSVWGSLREVLDGLLETPLVPAFHRLPRRVARFTRLAIFEGASRTMLSSISGTQLQQMEQIFPPSLDDSGTLDDVPEVVRGMVHHFRKPGAEQLFLDAGRSVEDGRALTLLRNTLSTLWCMEPADTTVEQLGADLEKGADKGQGNTAYLVRTRFPHRLGLWMREAEELLATQVVAYIGWALRQIRWLAIFLVLSLLFTTGMLSSYPFGGQGEVQGFFFFVAVAGIATLTTTMVQMNRNDLLSRINGSDAGRVNWSARFVVNLIVFAGLPLLAVLSSAFPPLRNLLSAWVGPLAGMLTSF